MAVAKDPLEADDVVTMNIAGVKVAWLPDSDFKCLPDILEPMAEVEETLCKEPHYPHVKCSQPDEIWENPQCIQHFSEPNAEAPEATYIDVHHPRRPDAKRICHIDHVADMHIGAFARPFLPDWHEGCLPENIEPVAEAPEGLFANIPGVVIQQKDRFLPDWHENCLPESNEP